MLNFTLDESTKCNLENPLRMILWAGDCVHNGITDIERLPNFDVYICFGFIHTLQANIEYLYNREKPGVICIIDTTSDEQMQRLIKEFKGRITTIDSDYNGNTPTMKPEYYRALLAEGGKAYNVEGINSMHLYMEDFINFLEIFAPILPASLRDKRRYTEEIIQLAKDNGLTVDMAWTSRDLDDPYYDEVRDRQKHFTEYRKRLNPNHISALCFNESTLEDYWSELSIRILTTNFKKALAVCEAKRIPLDSFAIYIDKFKEYLTIRFQELLENLEEFKESNIPFERIQELYKVSRIAFNGFSLRFGNFRDLRFPGGPVIYGYWFAHEKYF